MNILEGGNKTQYKICEDDFVLFPISVINKTFSFFFTLFSTIFFKRKLLLMKQKYECVINLTSHIDSISKSLTFFSSLPLFSTFYLMITHKNYDQPHVSAFNFFNPK